MQPTFDAVAEHLKCNFVVYGSYPAAMMVEEMKNTSKSVNPNPFPKLVTMRFDDNDVVYGTFGSGEFECKSYTKLKLALQKEVNFVKAINIPIGEKFFNCIDINMVAICCQIEVIDGKVSGVEVFVHPRFWEFALFNPIVTPIRFATPALTYIRAAYKAFTHGLQINLGGLNPCVGEFYRSHQDKVEAMKDWDKSPFSMFKIRRTTSSAFEFALRQCVNCPQRSTSSASGKCAARAVAPN